MYTVETFDLHADSLFYDLPYEKTAEGLDVNHIALRDIGLGIDSITFDGNALGLSLALRETHMKEKSGLEIRSLTGHFNIPLLCMYPDWYFAPRILTSGHKLTWTFPP